MRPTIAVLLGDRNGIGPELVAGLLARAEVHEQARLVGLGDPAVLAEGCAAAAVELAPEVVASLEGAATPMGGPAAAPLWLELRPEPGTATTRGRPSAAAGREMLEQLRRAARLAREGAVDGIVFAPLNKHAIHLADPEFRDELGFLAAELGHRGGYGELNVLGKLWTSRVTSHLALKEVSARISAASVHGAIRLLHDALVAAGRSRPRLAVSGLNPHAGDGGMFGREEIDHIAPGIARACADGIRAEGPFPADTVFVAARDGAYDAVVSMFHDQGQIAMKLMGFGRGVTVAGGLPVPITTPAHGTAYDIAGKGVATGEGLWQAFLLCCRMAAQSQPQGRP